MVIRKQEGQKTVANSTGKAVHHLSIFSSEKYYYYFAFF